MSTKIHIEREEFLNLKLVDDALAYAVSNLASFNIVGKNGEKVCVPRTFHLSSPLLMDILSSVESWGMDTLIVPDMPIETIYGLSVLLTHGHIVSFTDNVYELERIIDDYLKASSILKIHIDSRSLRIENITLNDKISKVKEDGELSDSDSSPMLPNDINLELELSESVGIQPQRSQARIKVRSPRWLMEKDWSFDCTNLLLPTVQDCDDEESTFRPTIITDDSLEFTATRNDNELSPQTSYRASPRKELTQERPETFSVTNTEIENSIHQLRMVPDSFDKCKRKEHTTVSDSGHHGESLSKQSSPTSSRLKVNETHQVSIRCVECKRNFVTAAALNAHLQTSSKHKKNPPKGTVKNNEKLVDSSNITMDKSKNPATIIDLPYQCPLSNCDYQCKHSNQAKKHLESHGL